MLRRFDYYTFHIYKVLKKVQPDTGVSTKTMNIMNFFAKYLFERIAAAASKLTHYSRVQNRIEKLVFM